MYDPAASVLSKWGIFVTHSWLLDSGVILLIFNFGLNFNNEFSGFKFWIELIKNIILKILTWIWINWIWKKYWIFIIRGVKYIYILIELYIIEKGVWYRIQVQFKTLRTPSTWWSSPNCQSQLLPGLVWDHLSAILTPHLSLFSRQSLIP